MRKILHIGTHKTATTSLQTALYQNRKALAEQGVIYPDLVPWGLRQRSGHHKMAMALADDPVAGGDLTRAVMSKAMTDAGEDGTILVSSEQYYRHKLVQSGADSNETQRENFIRLMAETFGHDTEIVIVLRRPDSFCESRHQERVKKTSYTRKINDYANDPDESVGFDYAFQIKTLQAYFSKVTVLIFEQIVQDKSAGGPELAFMKQLGLNVSFPEPPQRLNEALHPYLVDFKRLSNYQTSAKTESTVREFKTLLDLQSQGIFDWVGEKMTFWSEEDRAAFLARCQPSLDWVAQTFPHLRRADGALFPPVENLPPHVEGTPITVFEDILQAYTSAKGHNVSKKRRGRLGKKKRQSKA